MSKLVVDNDNITPVARLGKHTLQLINFSTTMLLSLLCPPQRQQVQVTSAKFACPPSTSTMRATNP